MVRDHIPQGAGTFVVFAALLDPDGLGCRNLDVIDVVAIPDRFKESVAEAKDEDVLHRLFAKIMIDPIDLIFREVFFDFDVERARRIEDPDRTASRRSPSANDRPLP